MYFFLIKKKKKRRDRLMKSRYNSWQPRSCSFYAKTRKREKRKEINKVHTKRRVKESIFLFINASCFPCKKEKEKKKLKGCC